MTVYLLEPFFGGSHRQWAEGWQRHSRHNIKIFGLPARHWKWRMHGAAITLAQQIQAAGPPDLFVASDMLDLATFKAISKTDRPCLVYWHENQITYPWSPTDADPKLQRDRHYGWINYTTALVADANAFNSQFHRSSFLAALGPFLRQFPDHTETETLAEITAKSSVLSLAVDLPALPDRTKGATGTATTLLWNHRWEYDKDPAAFFNLCYQLQQAGLPFQLVVLGEQHRKAPPAFAMAKQRLANHILHWGYAEDRATYWNWLQQCDLLPVTSRQDFFGISVVEAIHAKCFPLLPERLAFPEHIPTSLHQKHLYHTPEMLLEKTIGAVKATSLKIEHQLAEKIADYSWRKQIERYDRWISEFDQKM